MSLPDLTLERAEILRPDGLSQAPLTIAAGMLSDRPVTRRVDLSGYMVLPGIVDCHGDGFERHLAPRRGAMKERGEGLVAVEAELAANGITTAVLAQFWSWEGGLRAPEFADSMFRALAEMRDSVVTDLRGQLRFEINMLADYDRLPQAVADWGVDYVVFNDHLPHDRLATGRRPSGLVPQALKAGRNPEAHHEILIALHKSSDQVPPALDKLTATLRAQGVRLGSHDENTSADRAIWRARGAMISEFPETQDAAEAARQGGDGIILGAPNVVRGGSHKGNASAVDLVAMGLCDALASDYHYPSPRRAALSLAARGVLPLPQAWALVSDGPARVLGLTDRGRIEDGLRADLVILDAESKRVAATLAGGQFSYLSGEIATRFLG